ncbi:GNAT family N-acetyltransferase [Streptomyces sp. NBC_00053]|uniref:GNAT family N-acetyltransferase n=1 Tax=unclassified Streptomyces TaxID=2593676 RepID=UPI002259F417|nr:MULTISPECIES: GNAT family N-acetyltransferase [unclassified Streptomyces]MCX5504883.1 GNAT family N-acetyltransferase [Streptomyces sp. NBC_00052]MCX5546580.1 GNAT family N-acetyltransferase [Streptomyces sp. NBC_00051]
MTDLETPRLLLRPMNASDALRVISGTPGDGARWAPGYPSPGENSAAQRYLETCATTGDPGPFCSYEIRRRTDGLVIGGMGFHGAPDEDGDVTIGYGLVPSAQGMGYASEALRALLLFAREQGVRRVHGDTDLDNIASQRVMEAVGMRLEKQDERLKYYRTDWDPQPEL